MKSNFFLSSKNKKGYFAKPKSGKIKSSLHLVVHDHDNCRAGVKKSLRKKTGIIRLTDLNVVCVCVVYIGTESYGNRTHLAVNVASIILSIDRVLTRRSFLS